MSIHLMLDLETWSTRPLAAISQIAVMPFEMKKRGRIFQEKCFNAYVLLQDNVGVVDQGTLLFWMKEGSAAKQKLIHGLETEGVTCAEALQRLIVWPQETGIPGFESWGDIEAIWSKGAAFDLPILENAFNQHGLPAPWHYQTAACARTVQRTHGEITDIDTTSMTPHFAPDDCLYQIMALQRQLCGE